MTTPRDQLPDDDFASLAFELRIYARREAMGNEQVEEFFARYPNQMSERVLADLRASALRIGRAATALGILAEHEAEVRALIAARPRAVPAGGNQS